MNDDENVKKFLAEMLAARQRLNAAGARKASHDDGAPAEPATTTPTVPTTAAVIPETMKVGLDLTGQQGAEYVHHVNNERSEADRIQRKVCTAEPGNPQ